MTTQAQHPLTVRVRDDLVLDAGWWEEVTGPDGRVRRVVHPPAVSMFDQVVDYLQRTAVPVPRGRETLIGKEARAAVALCLRWGSYLAVLAERDKPMMPRDQNGPFDVVAREELHRIDLEASAGLERLIELMRTDHSRYLALVERARWLPLPSKRLAARQGWRGNPEGWAVELAPLLPSGKGAEHLGLSQPRLDTEADRALAAGVRAHPTRALANLLVQVAWRNGPIEELKGTRVPGQPLTQRRLTSDEERELLARALPRFRDVLLMVLGGLALDTPSIDWPEQVLRLTAVNPSYPAHWPLTGSAVEVSLPGAEGEATGD